VDAAFKKDLAKNKKVVASHTRGDADAYSAANLTDHDFETYWTVNDDVNQATLTLDLEGKTSINRLLLQEYIPLGQRIRSFVVEYWNGSDFVELDKQTTVG